MTRAKILIAANSTWNIINFRLGLIRALLDEGFEVVAVAPQDYDPEPLNQLGCRYIALDLDRKGASVVRDALLIYKYRKLLLRERPSVLLGFTVKPNIYASLAAATVGIPVINNVSGLGTAFIHDGLINRLVKQLYRIAFAKSYRVFFQNPDDRKLFECLGLVKPDQSVVIPGSGVDLSHFIPEGARASGHGSALTFLLVGRLLRDKGIFEFVEAARQVKRANPGVLFRLLGPLDPQNRTAISAGELDVWCKEGVIEYLGSVADVRPFIASSDCVVLPSYREGTPRSLLEAAAMARPLIATDVPGCREIVDDDINGFLCRVRDASDLAAAMNRMLALDASSRLSMGIASRKKVEREYSERIIVDHYLQVIKSLLSR